MIDSYYFFFKFAINLYYTDFDACFENYTLSYKKNSIDNVSAKTPAFLKYICFSNAES